VRKADSLLFASPALLAALATLAATGACGRTELDPPFPLPMGDDIAMKPVFQQSVNTDLDIIFMVDNSFSMREEQENLARNFPTFMNALEALPEGVPNVHIGVVTSDLGAGRFEPAGCKKGGDRGAFQVPGPSLTGACSAAPKGQNYIIDVGNQRNYTGTIGDAFSCIARVGTNGCGFEHQLAAVKRALGGDPEGIPPENKGFLRKGALLAVVLITDEDDCSAPEDTDLFDPSQVYITDPYGPLDSFRCNEFGHMCNIDGAMRPPPRTEAVSNVTCHSNENGKLTAVSDIVDFLKSLKDNPNDVIVAAITGQAMPYSTRLVRTEVVQNDQRTGVFQYEPRINASCGMDPSMDPTHMTNGLAYPAVRIKDFIDAFGPNGTIESICDGDLSPAMGHIGDAIAGRIRHQCVEGPLVDTDPDAPGIQPNCEVFQQTVASDGLIRTPIRGCDVSAAPCWRLHEDDSCPTKQEVVVDLGSIPAAPRTRIVVICETCKDPDDRRCPAQ